MIKITTFPFWRTSDFSRFAKIFFLCLLLHHVAAQAQEKRIDLGIKAGLNLSNWLYDDHFRKPMAGDFKGRSAIRTHYGFFLKIKLAKRFGVQPEVLLSGQGDYSIRTTYLNFPISLYYRMFKRFYLYAGIQKGILKSSGMQGGTSFNSTDFGYTLGASCDFHKKMNFTVRYIRGIEDIVQSDLSASQIRPVAYNSVIQFSISYKIKNLRFHLL